MTEHYKSVSVIDLSVDGARSGKDLYFERADNPAPPDDKVEQLRKDYENAMLVIRSAPFSDNVFMTLVNQLKVGAEVGLVGPRFDLAAGLAQLNQVKRSAEQGARRYRNRFLFELLFIGLALALASMALAFVCQYKLSRWLGDADLQTAFASSAPWLTAWLLLHPGVVLGVVFTGFVLNRGIEFDKLGSFDPYQFPPLLRFAYTTIIAYVLFVALWHQWLMLGIGGELLNDVTKHADAGFGIGLICGIAEAAIVELLIRLKPAERQGA